MTTPVNVTVTGAAGQIGYQLLFRIASGQLLVEIGLAMNTPAEWGVIKIRKLTASASSTSGSTATSQ